MILIQFSLNIIYLLDILIMFFVFGIRDFFLKRSWALRLELLFQILHFCKIKDYYTLWFQDEIENEAAFIGFIQMTILFRILRIFTFLAELQQWEFFLKAIKVMRGPFFNLTFTLYSLYFLYSLIGQEIFGGKINSEQFDEIFRLNPDSDIGPDYIWLNYNDFASGLITLFSMMLFNNWQFIWDQFDFAIENKAVTNSYFLSFMVMATYVIINILMAFVIDVYTSIEDAQREELAERKAIIKEGQQGQKVKKTNSLKALFKKPKKQAAE